MLAIYPRFVQILTFIYFSPSGDGLLEPHNFFSPNAPLYRDFPSPSLPPLHSFTVYFAHEFGF